MVLCKENAVELPIVFLQLGPDGFTAQMDRGPFATSERLGETRLSFDTRKGHSPRIGLVS